MASITKTARGYRAQIYVQGVRESASRRTKREAEAWAAQRETEIRDASATPAGDRTTLADVLSRYAREVSPSKRGRRWEVLRLDLFGRDPVLPVAQPISALTPEQIAAWRDHRSKSVQAGTVIREMGLLSSVLEHARREWRLIPANPCRDVRKPREPDHREVVIGWRQIRVMVRAMGHRSGGRVTEVRQAVALCFLVALRTGMRAGELCGLTWDRVRDDYVILPITKTVPRNVPIEPRTRHLIERLRGWDERYVFGLKAASLDALFRRYRARTGLSGFTFHDSRHTAATRLAQRLDVLDLCKVMGWRNTAQALVYYNPTASEIATRIAHAKPGQSRRSGSSQTRSA